MNSDIQKPQSNGASAPNDPSRSFGAQLHEVAAGVRLTNAERVRMRTALIRHIRPEPVRVSEFEPAFETSEPLVSDYQPSPYAPRASMSHTAFGWLAALRFAPATLALFGMVGAGVTFAAEDAVPGDILYPIKVNVTEELRGVITFSDEARADWATRRAERRLEEAEELASAGRLDASMSAEIAGAFERHTDSARDSLQRLRDDDHSGAAMAIGSKFETALAAHHAILSHIAVGAPTSDTPSGTGDIAERVRIKVEEVANLRFDSAEEAALAANSSLMATSGLATTSDSAGAPAAKASGTVLLRIKTGAEDQIRSAQKTLTAVSPTLGAAAKARAVSEITAAQGLFEGGEEALALGDSTRAVWYFEQALARARKIELYMQTEMRLNINLLNDDGVFGAGQATSTASTTNPAVEEEVVPAESAPEEPTDEEDGSESGALPEADAIPLPIEAEVTL